MKLQSHHQAYLERTARVLQTRLGAPIRPEDVLGALLDTAIADEGRYDPDVPDRPLSAQTRAVLHIERDTRTQALSEHVLFDRLRHGSARLVSGDSAGTKDPRSGK